MSKFEAKELSLEVWRYLAEHPEIGSKRSLPGEILCKIEPLRNWCPLCALFFKLASYCPGCPLSGKNYCGNNYFCETPSEPYFRWEWEERRHDVRREAASEIVRRIEAWEVDE
jgi:hypothetical protein